MGIKASICITSYEKHFALPNVFYSISRQKTNFEFEVCFLDDCSFHDPTQYYYEFLNVKHKKGIRLKKHIGNRANVANFKKLFPSFRNSNSMTFEMVSPETEVVILQSADVIWSTDDMLQKFVDSMKPKEQIICDVVHIDVRPDLYMNFKNGVDDLRHKFGSKGYYQGEIRYQVDSTGAWGPFLMPFYYKDLREIVKYQEHGNEFGIRMTLEPEGFKPIYRHDIIGIHQLHDGIPSVEVTTLDNLVNWKDSDPERIIL